MFRVARIALCAKKIPAIKVSRISTGRAQGPYVQPPIVQIDRPAKPQPAGRAAVASG
ncbi:MAG: hypothetical protein WCI64_08145 [Chlorobium sp.]